MVWEKFPNELFDKETINMFRPFTQNLSHPKQKWQFKMVFKIHRWNKVKLFNQM